MWHDLFIMQMDLRTQLSFTWQRFVYLTRMGKIILMFEIKAMMLTEELFFLFIILRMLQLILLQFFWSTTTAGKVVLQLLALKTSKMTRRYCSLCGWIVGETLVLLIASVIMILETTGTLFVLAVITHILKHSLSSLLMVIHNNSLICHTGRRKCITTITDNLAFGGRGRGICRANNECGKFLPWASIWFRYHPLALPRCLDHKGDPHGVPEHR